MKAGVLDTSKVWQDALRRGSTFLRDVARSEADMETARALLVHLGLSPGAWPAIRDAAWERARKAPGFAHDMVAESIEGTAMWLAGGGFVRPANGGEEPVNQSQMVEVSVDEEGRLRVVKGHDAVAVAAAARVYIKVRVGVTRREDLYRTGDVLLAQPEIGG